MNERYLLMEVIGKGAFGVVYRAFDCDLSKAVTIKKVQLPALFEKQGAMILMNMNCPYCPLYLDSFEDEKYYYLVTSYITGRNLGSYKGKLNEIQMFHLARCMFHVLKQIWEMDYTFNDIKPSNILFDGKKTFYLIDFGSVSPKMSGQVRFGSPPFASKEYSEGQKFDWRSDLYSLSKTFYYVYKKRNLWFMVWYRKASHNNVIKRFQTPKQAMLAFWMALFGSKMMLIFMMVLLFVFHPIQRIYYEYCLNQQCYLEAVKVDSSRLEAYELYLSNRDINDFKTWQPLVDVSLEKVEDSKFLWQCVFSLMSFKEEKAWICIERILNQLDDLKAKRFLQLMKEPTMQHFEDCKEDGTFIYAYGISHLSKLDKAMIYDLCDAILLDKRISKEEMLYYYCEFALYLNDVSILKEAYHLLSQQPNLNDLKASIAYRIFENGYYNEGWLHLAKEALENVKLNGENLKLRIKIENQIMQWGSQS